MRIKIITDTGAVRLVMAQEIEQIQYDEAGNLAVLMKSGNYFQAEGSQRDNVSNAMAFVDTVAQPAPPAPPVP